MNMQNINGRLKACWKRVANLNKNNQKLLKDFSLECEARGLSSARVLFYVDKMNVIARDCGRNLNELEEPDIKSIVADIERGNFSEWTKASYKVCIKKFYQWVGGYGWDSKKYPDKVEWIKTGARKNRLKDPVILTKEEVKKIISVASGLREKALASFMYESGCRCPDELLNLKYGDIVFDEYGAKVRIHGIKNRRTIRLVACVPYLRQWYENHSTKDDNDYLWICNGKNSGYRVISYNTLRMMVGNWKRKAGITKRMSPYTFRRTRYTHLASKLPTQILYKFMGQVQGSKAIERYVNLDNETTDEVILNFNNVKVKSNGNGDIIPLFCSRCQKQNPPELEYCQICSAPLTEMARMNVEKKQINELREKYFQEFVGELVEKIRKEPELVNKLV